MMALIEDALLKTIIAEPIEKIIRAAVYEGVIAGETPADQAKAALEKDVISEDQYELVCESDQARQLVIAVDDFAPEDLARGWQQFVEKNGDKS